MPMKKHNVPRNFLRLPVKETAQGKLTGEAFGRLLGIKSDIENIVASNERLFKGFEEDAVKRLQLKQKLSLQDGPLDTRDQQRVDAAAKRRLRLQAKRARSYARCVGRNPCLHEEQYMARYKIGNNNYVDKHFIKGFG